MEVRLHNTGGGGMSKQEPGGASVIGAGGFNSVSAPGDYGASSSDAGSLDAVVSRGSDRVWVRCVFPVFDVLCTATTYP